MRADRPLRIPLQIGTSALHSLARASALFVPGIIGVGVPVFAFLYLTDTVGGLGKAGVYIFVVIIAPGLTLLSFAWKHARRARDARPSDLVIDGHGFTVIGGPLEKQCVAWAEVASVTLETPAKPDKDGSEVDDSDLKQLCVYVRRNNRDERLLLAAADRAIEQSSLEELAQTLRADRGEPGETVKRTPNEKDAVELLTCAHCGAVVAPSSEIAVRCTHCHQSVPIPDEMRERLRDAEAVEARPDAIVAKLLDQPDARRVGRLLAGAAAFMLAAWPVALFLLARNYRERALTVGNTAFVFLFVVACIVGFFALIRGQLVDRQALRLVTLDFAAHAPTAPGEPFLCRSCMAPLPDRGERVLVGCLYCRSENVLGIDLRREASAARNEARSLEEALSRRATERRRWRGVTAAALAIIGLAVFSLRHGIGHNTRTWPLEQRCDGGDTEACIELADLIGRHPAPDVRADRKRAARLYERACDLKSGRACEELADLYDDFMAAPGGRDAVRAFGVRLRACELGRRGACRALAVQYDKGDIFAHVKSDPGKAQGFYRQACALGDQASCTSRLHD